MYTDQSRKKCINTPSSTASTDFFNRRPYYPTDTEDDDDNEEYRNHVSPVPSSGDASPDGSREPESSDIESVTCLSDREAQRPTIGQINEDAQPTPSESPSSSHSGPMAHDTTVPNTEDEGVDEDDRVSSSSDTGLPKIVNVESVLHLPWGSSPVPGTSEQARRGGAEISGHKEIQGTACYGRHAFSARHPTPERHPQPQRSNTCLLYTSPSPRDS